MFTLQLDLCLYFSPPMDEKGTPIRMTRAIELPFAPVAGMSLTGNAIDQCPTPEGFTLKAVVWDLDRARFTADIIHIHVDLPFDSIGAVLRGCIEEGWALGSYMEDFVEVTSHEIPAYGVRPKPRGYYPDWVDGLDGGHRLPPSKRTKSFKKAFRAMIRLLCEIRNSEKTAYAMWKSSYYFDPAELKRNESKPAKAYKDALSEFSQMPFDAQWEWRERICKTYPRLDSIIP